MDKLEQIKVNCTLANEARKDEDKTYYNGIHEEDILYVITDIAQSLRKIKEEYQNRSFR